MNGNIRTPGYVIELARELRRNMTWSEKLLWEKLKLRQLKGFRFRRQHPIYRYILDFYCFEKKLAIEIDGDIHNERKEYDYYRDDFLESMGIKTLRFCCEDILQNVDSVLLKIEEALNS